MRNLFKIFGLPMLTMAAVLSTNSANAATGRTGGYNPNENGTINSANRTVALSTPRMPSMPTLPGNSIGNISPNVPTTPGDSTIITPPKPPVSECTDGGEKDSKYTIENCMNDVLACVNNGALPGGLNDLFNEDLRNSIFNGMNLCYVQVEKCTTQVRRNCRNIYASSSDVWWDFNSRKIQPEYYSFILRKTGLTPTQAENTCGLLDKNTYGDSFAAVSNNGKTTSEYNNQIGAYNNQAGGATKNAPQGVKINNNNPGVDGARGHYARWDATTGECLIRVAAYNKDSHIKNSWLFGALGDDKPAEIWVPAGDSFSCNKDLFGFSLMNNTSTVAVVGVGGGTLIGAGTGAIVGHGGRDFDCNDPENRKQLAREIRNGGYTNVLNGYLPTPISFTNDEIDPASCENIPKLYDVYVDAKSVNKNCVQKIKIEQTTTTAQSNGSTITTNENSENESVICPEYPGLKKALSDGGKMYECEKGASGCVSIGELNNQISSLSGAFDAMPILKGQESNMVSSTLIGAGIGAGAGGLATAITAFVEKGNINCRVGDGLEKISNGKSHSIGTLKDFYVKWNLRVPDTIMPTARVKDCESWKMACGTLKNLNQCAIAQINYVPDGSKATTLVNSACAASGSVCIENRPVAISQGACE